MCFLMVNEYHIWLIIRNKINVEEIHHPGSRSELRKVRAPRNLLPGHAMWNIFVGICWNSLKQIFGSVFVFNDSFVVNLLRENISPCPSDRWVLHFLQKIHGHKVIVTLFENKNNSKLLRPSWKPPTFTIHKGSFQNTGKNSRSWRLLVFRAPLIK